MLKKDTSSWARACDTCHSSPCSVYCQSANQLSSSRHERVWVCQACERAPAAVLCKADNAALCAACDADIHSANPLARRHHRVPIGPDPIRGPDTDDLFGEEEDEADTWLLLNPLKSGNNNNGFLFGGGGGDDQYLDFVEYKDDSIVPVQYEESKQVVNQQQQHNFQFDEEEEDESYSGSLGIRVSVSSLDVGIVPESATSEMSISHSRPPKGTIDLFLGHTVQLPQPLSPMDREARVLRYREKKKTRKFEKTIRYASRKAYAETRPRIKGRFAKRTNVEMEVDQMFSDTRYGVVPSFV